MFNRSSCLELFAAPAFLRKYMTKYENGGNWEQRRYEVAKEMLPVIFKQQCDFCDKMTELDADFDIREVYGDFIKQCVLVSIRYADRLIEELKQ